MDVVTAQTTLLSDQVTLNSLQVEEMLSTVQLVQALGGGWDRSAAADAGAGRSPRCQQRLHHAALSRIPCGGASRRIIERA